MTGESIVLILDTAVLNLEIHCLIGFMGILVDGDRIVSAIELIAFEPVLVGIFVIVRGKILKMERDFDNIGLSRLEQF